jgi:hypothetical protein
MRSSSARVRGNRELSAPKEKGLPARKQTMPDRPPGQRQRSAVMDGIALFEDARGAAVQLWPLKHRLWHAGNGRFYKSSRECKAIMALCWWDPTDSIRSLVDDAACRYADVHGDDLFKKTVDGTELNAVTRWFYGTLKMSGGDGTREYCS